MNNIAGQQGGALAFADGTTSARITRCLFQGEWWSAPDIMCCNVVMWLHGANQPIVSILRSMLFTLLHADLLCFLPSGNSATSGGAVLIVVANQNLVFQFCVFESNSVSVNGGAVTLTNHNEMIDFDGVYSATANLLLLYFLLQLHNHLLSFSICRLYISVQCRWCGRRCCVLIFQQHQCPLYNITLCR